MWLVSLLAVVSLGEVTTGEATIRGRITDALTHQPMMGVRVSYCCTSVTVDTDASGSFLLHVEPAFAESKFTIAKKGYVTLQTTVPGPPSDRDFELMPSGHLSGRVVDGDSGEPLAGFRVDAMYRGAPPTLHLATPTGKDGSFAMVGEMTPGNYIVRVRPQVEFRFAEGGVKASQDSSQGYVATWFPGMASADAAVPVAISPGENRSIEFRLTRRELFHLSGTIDVPKGRETDRLKVKLIRNGGVVGNSEEKFKPGPFHIDGLAPGSYILSFSTRTGAALNQPVEVTNRNINDLRINLHIAASIKASVTVLEEKAARPEHLSFRALPFQFTDMSADPSDSLYIRGVPPGQYWPILSMSAGYAVTAMSYDGQSIYNAPISIEAEESTINFVITSRPAAVIGVVYDANQKPVPHAMVVLSSDPAPAQIDPFSEQRFRTKSGANGAFRIANLAPGHYTVMAGSGDGQKVDLNFGQTANVNLQLK